MKPNGQYEATTNVEFEPALDPKGHQTPAQYVGIKFIKFLKDELR
jgi:hypothetical protein